MKNIVKKIQKVEIAISEEKGEFQLFALVLREDASNKWDLVAAAPWITKSKQLALEYIAKEVQASLTKDELLLLSRIVLIDENNPILKAMAVVQIKHGASEFKDCNFSGLQIKHMFLITSQKS